MSGSLKGAAHIAKVIAEEVAAAVKAASHGAERVHDEASTASRVLDAAENASARHVPHVELHPSPGGSAPPTLAPTEGRDGRSNHVSPQKQARHLENHPLHTHGGFFKNSADAQKVLTAFHDGRAEVLARTANGNIIVQFDGVTGYNVNVRHGYVDQPTHVFIIKGTASVSVVPKSPVGGSSGN